MPIATCALAIVCFYLYNLGGVGVLSTDEPRYAAIGQTMARTGDWMTPMLWGSPWFEKPPLLYWMSALFFALGDKPEVAARLPVALLSLAFLALATWLVAREFGRLAGTVSVGLLATSAGWVAYSNFCLTDLPMAVFFSLALLLALPLLRKERDEGRLPLRFAGIGLCLGLAVLAKGLVPLALAVPLAWFLRRWWRVWWCAAVGLLGIAAPWYVAMYQRFGMAFLNELFLKQHFARLYSMSIQHVQPWYYYVPVLLGALFPWTPMLAIFAGKRTAGWDERRTVLLVTVVFGFIFFSVVVNKLPGYLLPLLPALWVLVGAELKGWPWLILQEVAGGAGLAHRVDSSDCQGFAGCAGGGEGERLSFGAFRAYRDVLCGGTVGGTRIGTQILAERVAGAVCGGWRNFSKSYGLPGAG